MTTPIRIGIVGAGNNTRVRHIPGFKAISGVELVSVCNRSPESSHRVAETFGIPTIHENWRELVTANDIDAVMIGTWPYMHREITCAALAAGKHVLTEARMAMNLAEARAMLAASQAHPNQIAQIVPSPLTFRVDRTIQDLLADGYLGTLYTMTVRGAVPSFADLTAPLHWRQRQSLSGMNILNMGIWYEAAMRWVGHAARVYARGRICVPHRRDAETNAITTVDVPDHIDILVDLECGAQATYTFSSVTGLAPGAGAWLYGSEGTLHFEHSSNKLFGGRRGDSALQEIAIPPAKAGGWRVEEEFIGAIRGQETIQYTGFADGVRYMEFTEAVHQSLASGQAITLPL